MYKKGFSLIELLVCLTILSIVIVIGMGLLLATNASVGASRAQRRSMDNLNFAIESMSRSITYGTDFSCNGGSSNSSCPVNVSPSGIDNLTFNGYYLSGGSPIQIKYSLGTKAVGSNPDLGYIARTVNSGTRVSLTDDRVDIQELYFYVYHAEDFGTDPEQPRVTVVIRGVSKASGTDQEFFIQTTLSQRDLKL